MKLWSLLFVAGLLVAGVQSHHRGATLEYALRKDMSLPGRTLAMTTHVGFQPGHLPVVAGSLATRFGATSQQLTDLQARVNKLGTDLTNTGDDLKRRVSSADNLIGSIDKTIITLKEKLKSLSQCVTEPQTGLVHQVKQLDDEFKAHQNQAMDRAHM